MPAPASIVLRELGSPVPAHTCCVSDGAIASMPIEITRLSSNNGGHVMPLFMVFQIPPPARATKSAFDGPGIPTMSDERPSKLAGPSCRHLMPAMLAESMVCAWTLAPENTSAAPASAERKRLRCIALSDDGGMTATGMNFYATIYKSVDVSCSRHLHFRLPSVHEATKFEPFTRDTGVPPMRPSPLLTVAALASALVGAPAVAQQPALTPNQQLAHEVYKQLIETNSP